MSRVTCCIVSENELRAVFYVNCLAINVRQRKIAMRIVIIQGNFGEDFVFVSGGDCNVAAFGGFIMAKILIRLVAFIRLIFNGL